MRGIAGAAVAALALAGCNDSACKQGDVKDMSPGTSARLNDVRLGEWLKGEYEASTLIAVGDGGVIVTARRNYGPLHVEETGVGDLYAALLGPSNRAYAAGAGGILLGSEFGSDRWEPIATGSTAAIRELAWIWVRVDVTQEPTEYQIAVGDDVVLVRDPVDDSWDLVTPPAGGWGELRAVVGDDLVHVAGLGGVIWAATDPRGVWVREDSGTTEDLLAGDSNWRDEPVLVGTGGTYLRREMGAWKRDPTPITDDLLALDFPVALAAGGRVYDVLAPEEPIREEWAVSGARSLAYEDQIVTVGDAGKMTRAPAFCD
jgi:hypothetical protein